MSHPPFHADVAVIGGGSGGVAAALAAARCRVKTVLIEQDALLGGTSTSAGVTCWEPVCGATGMPRRLFDRLTHLPGACGIYTIARHCFFMRDALAEYPGGEQRIVPFLRYQDTLKTGWDYHLPWSPGRWNGVVFEPLAWHHAATALLAETGCCHVITGQAAVTTERANTRSLGAVTLANGDRITAKIWIDNAGALARDAGCQTLTGQDPYDRFHEPDAPIAPSKQVNGATRIFRISPTREPAVQPLPKDIPADCWWSPSFPKMVATQYPNGDFNCNMLPTITGQDLAGMTMPAALAETERRVLAFWHHLQTAWPEFRHYAINMLFPKLGVRESFRVVCRYMLTENDLTTGLAGQTHDDLIATADHPMDRHGAGRAARQVTGPYGIPYRCLLPVGIDNLILAGRIAGFSSLAASSCRLARTIMQLGQAAGFAAAIACHTHALPADISVRRLQCLVNQENQS